MTDATPQAALTIDALGCRCPVPIILLSERIKEVPVGGVIAVQADDEAARLDIPAWCRMKSHDFLDEIPLERGSTFLIRRHW